MKTVRQMIEEILINPLLSHRPRSIPEDDYLEEIFCLKTRPIGRYRCLALFELTGNVVEGNLVYPESRYRLKSNEQVVVRTDDTRPDTVDIETERYGVIRISSTHWEYVKTRLWKGRGQDEV